MSNLGRPDRQLFYDVNGIDGGDPETLKPHTYMQFMFGDVWEAILLYLAEQAGHKVENQQKQVEIDGIVGHQDATIDGVTVDVKSASPYGMKKFEDGSIREDDPFGYMEQLAAYSHGNGQTDGAFLAVQKVTGKLVLCQFDADELAEYNVEERVAYVKEMVEEADPPEKCYQPVPEGKSGNMRLDIGCQYCPYKFHCWQDANNGVGLRTFIYSTGPKYLTDVKKEPKTMEVTI